MKNHTSFLRPWVAWVTLLVVVLAVLTMVLVPVFVIMPFKAQTQGGMELSYTLKRWSPLVSLVASALALGLAVWLWPRSRRWWRKAALVVVIIPLLAATWFARQNHFEWMFRPIPDPRFIAIDQAKDLGSGEPIIAVTDRGEALAFPITRIGYHHLVNTTLGGVPIVATY